MRAQRLLQRGANHFRGNHFLRFATSFLLGAASVETARRYFPHEISPSRAMSVISAHYLSQGWKPITVEDEHGLQFDVSLFATGLVSTTAYVVVEQGGEYYVALNVENRNGKDVADVPCGFLNSGDVTRLTRSKEILKRRAGLSTSGRTVQGMQRLLKAFARELNDDVVVILEEPQIDSSTQAGMKRELFEESSLRIPDDVQPRLILLNSVENGRRFYPRYLSSWSIPKDQDLPSLIPEGSGISKSQWVNVKDITFQTDEDGFAATGTAKFGNTIFTIKQTDDTARDLAYAIGLATHGRHGCVKFPGEPIIDPGVTPKLYQP